MEIKKAQLLVSVASLMFVSVANAQPYMTGSTGVVEYGNGSTWDATSLTMDPLNLITTSETGLFLTFVPSHSDLTADSTTLTGLSTSPTPENINDFFVFSTPDSGKGTLGTTPNNRFDFNLATITDEGNGAFAGTGTLVDTQGTYGNTAATFTLTFSSPADAPLDEGDYSFTLAASGVQAVPEPATISLLVTGLLGALAIRRRKV